MKAMVSLFAAAGIVSGAAVAGSPGGDDGWSEVNRDLQARVTLVEKPAINGTRSLVPYLELRNVGNFATPLKIRCNSGHVRFALVDANGEKVRDGWLLPRSGPHADPGTISLPIDSLIRLGMYCPNWGVPADAAAMVATDSGAWVLAPGEKGKVFLRATITGERVKSDADRIWYGTLETPPVKVDWKE